MAAMFFNPQQQCFTHYDFRYNNLDRSLSSSNPSFFHQQETLISRQIQKKPRLTSPWWSVDESFDELSVIFKKLPPITLNSTAGVSKIPPVTSTADVSKAPPEIIVIEEDEIEEETTESSLIVNNTPPMSASSFSTVSNSSPDVIVIDDDEEEEIVAMSHDNNLKLDSNCKKSSSINDNEEDSGSVVTDSEKEKNNGGDGGFGHVSLDDLGVTVEDLKNIPWEAFDPSRGIKSVIMHPSLGWICSTNY